MNQFQKEALKVYAFGEFSDIPEYRYDDKHGDALLSFVLAELSDDEECFDRDTAIQRIKLGITDLQIVLEKLQNA